MSQVNVTINGKIYRIACEDGQETHLEGLAATLDQAIGHLRQSFGEIGDQRLTVMAAIMVMDEQAESRRRIQALEMEVRALRAAQNGEAAVTSEVDMQLAKRIEVAATRLEALAGALTSRAPTN